MSRATRATHDHQKQDRRMELLEAARLGLQSTGYAALTMAQVAQEAGVAKGTLYLSFPTKEALFLALLQEEFDAWFDAVAEALGRLRRPTVTRVAGTIAQAIAERPTFRMLVGIMHQVLEHNLPPEDAEAFKRHLLDRFMDLASCLGQSLPGFGPAKAGRFLLRTHALVVGLQGMAEPSPVLKAIMQGPEWAPLRVDFEDELRRALRDLLQGMWGEKGHE